MSRLSQDATSMSLSTVERQRSWRRLDVTWRMCWLAKEQCVSLSLPWRKICHTVAVWAKVLCSFLFLSLDFYFRNGHLGCGHDMNRLTQRRPVVATLDLENLEKRRSPSAGVEAIYFAMPTEDSVRRIIRDFKVGRPATYSAAHLFFLAGT